MNKTRLQTIAYLLIYQSIVLGMEPRALHILVKHSTTELQLFKWNCQKPHITLVPMSEYFKILFQNQNANEVISGSKCMNSFSLLSICLFPWLSKTGPTFRLHFIPGSSEWLPHCSRGQVITPVLFFVGTEFPVVC